jgi:hypothetical protein
MSRVLHRILGIRQRGFSRPQLQQQHTVLGQFGVFLQACRQAPPPPCGVQGFKGFRQERKSVGHVGCLL